MSFKELGIERSRVPQSLIATIRTSVQEREEIATLLDEIASQTPSGALVGPPFCFFHFVTSVQDGSDVEAGFPVDRPVDTGRIRTRGAPALEVLSLKHQGSAEELSAAYRKLYGAASAQGLISDEFCREVYPDRGGSPGNTVEIQLVLHNWNALLADNLDRVLGAAARREITKGSDAITLDTGADERFRFTRQVVDRLDGRAREQQKYDALSGCAHVFPEGQIEKLRHVYQAARKRTADSLTAVDEVLEFMAGDPGWKERPVREGRILFATKGPRDPKAHAAAKDDLERRRAYCFCPLVRDHMDQGMSPTFCYCGSGWYRRQWEGATGKPVTIDIIKSVLKGDEVCQFAIRLADDL